jgi:hypothetical protein
MAAKPSAQQVQGRKVAAKPSSQQVAGKPQDQLSQQQGERAAAPEGGVQQQSQSATQAAAPEGGVHSAVQAEPPLLMLLILSGPSCGRSVSALMQSMHLCSRGLSQGSSGISLCMMGSCITTPPLMSTLACMSQQARPGSMC